MFNIISVNQRPMPPRKRRGTGRLYLTKKNESIAENFVLRDSAKPVKEYRKHILSQLAAHGVNVEGARWSIYAGCACPCSPGFILPNHYQDVWVTFEYITPPSPRPLTEREAYRASVLTSLV